jgi:hypothetical protein
VSFLFPLRDDRCWMFPVRCALLLALRLGERAGMDVVGTEEGASAVVVPEKEGWTLLMSPPARVVPPPGVIIISALAGCVAYADLALLLRLLPPLPPPPPLLRLLLLSPRLLDVTDTPPHVGESAMAVAAVEAAAAAAAMAARKITCAWLLSRQVGVFSMAARAAADATEYIWSSVRTAAEVTLLPGVEI